MARSKIDGEQVQDETLTGVNVLDESLTGDDVLDESLTTNEILDGTIQRKDINIVSVGQSLIRRLLVGIGLAIDSSTGADSGTGDVTIINKSGNFGRDAESKTKVVNNGQDFSGGSFQQYDILTFNVSEDSTNSYRINTDFIWSHNAGSNDARFQLWVDGSQFGEELRIEPKDAGNDQRFQNNILKIVDNLSVGAHTIELRVRPATASRVTQVYSGILEVWRVK